MPYTAGPRTIRSPQSNPSTPRRNSKAANDAAMNDLRSKITDYGNFISQTLEPLLRTAVTEREETEGEISEYADLRAQLELLHARYHIDKDKVGGDSGSSGGSSSRRSQSSPEPLEAMVDLCHSAAYCRAVIPNPRTVYVHVGMGFHAEFTLGEAISFIDKRLGFLETGLLNQRSDRAAAVAEDVEKALELLEDLGNDLRELEEQR